MCKFVTICCPITLKIFETNTVTGELFTGQWIFKLVAIFADESTYIVPVLGILSCLSNYDFMG